MLFFCNTNNAQLIHMYNKSIKIGGIERFWWVYKKQQTPNEGIQNPYSLGNDRQ
jgi:hypothetical protein